MTQYARLLKVIVIGLGLLIVLGVALIVYEMIGRAGQGTAISGASVSAGDSSVPAGDYGSSTVILPDGARVIAMTGEGDRLSLLVEDADGGQRVMTIDRRNGALLGVITLESK